MNPVSEKTVLEEGVKLLTNDLAQSRLSSAERYLSEVLENQPNEENLKMQLLLSLFKTIRVYSASGNEIPGFLGLGISEAYNLAGDVLENKPKIDRDITLKTFKPILLAFNLEK